MTEALYQFDFSENTIKKTNRDMLFVFLPVLIVCLFGFALFISGFKIKEALLCSCAALLITLVIGAIEIPLIQLRQRKIKAFIHNDKIVKQCGKRENSISWDNIARIKINENSKGEIIRVQIRGKDKTVLSFYGLNEIERLASMLRERISDDILVNTKRSRLDQPIIGLISAISTMIFMAIIASFGEKAINIFAILVAFGTSFFLLLYRPLSKSDIGLKWIEITVSLTMFLLGIYGLISFLVGIFC
jgi:hypothetical protein